MTTEVIAPAPPARSARARAPRPRLRQAGGCGMRMSISKPVARGSRWSGDAAQADDAQLQRRPARQRKSLRARRGPAAAAHETIGLADAGPRRASAPSPDRPRSRSAHRAYSRRRRRAPGRRRDQLVQPDAEAGDRTQPPGSRTVSMCRHADARRDGGRGQTLELGAVRRGRPPDRPARRAARCRTRRPASLPAPRQQPAGLQDAVLVHRARSGQSIFTPPAATAEAQFCVALEEGGELRRRRRWTVRRPATPGARAPVAGG